MYLRSVRSKYLKIICYASEYFTRLTATLTFSSTLSIRHLMRRHVLLSNGLELQNSLWTHGFLLYIQLYCCLLFIVHEYWRNFTSYVIRFITHLYCDLQLYRQYSHKTYTKLQLLLSISCLASFTYIDFITRTHHHRFAV